jgi:hypothetical protein
VHRGADDQSFRSFFDNRTNSIAWHSDVTYENQPPGTTFLYALDVPDAGGDTIFANQAKAYERLSPAFRERLEGLQALHSGYEQATAAENKGTFVRRAPVSTVSCQRGNVRESFTDGRNRFIRWFAHIPPRARRRCMSTRSSHGISSASSRRSPICC